MFLSLILAWGASYLATKHPTHQRNLWLAKVTIMASLASSVLLLVALGAIAWESIERLSSPKTVDGVIIIVVATIGVVISLLIVIVILITTWKLPRDSIDLSIDAVPHDIDILYVQHYLSNLKNVSDIHGSACFGTEHNRNSPNGKSRDFK